MILVTDKLSTESFHAFIDEQLTDEQFEQVEQLLDDIPEKIEEIQQCQIINERLREVFDPVVQEPMPDDLYQLALNGTVGESQFENDLSPDYVDNMDGLTDYNEQPENVEDHRYGLFDDNHGLDYEFNTTVEESDVLEEDSDEFADIEALGADDGLEDFDIDAFDTQQEEFSSFPDIFDESNGGDLDTPESYRSVKQSPMGEAALKSMEKLQLDSVGIEDGGNSESRKFSGRRRLKERRKSRLKRKKGNTRRSSIADILTEDNALELRDEEMAADSTSAANTRSGDTGEPTQKAEDIQQEVRAVRIDDKQTEVIEALTTGQTLELEPIENNERPAVDPTNDVQASKLATAATDSLSGQGVVDEIHAGKGNIRPDETYRPASEDVKTENVEANVITSEERPAEMAGLQHKNKARKNLKQDVKVKIKKTSAQASVKPAMQEQQASEIVNNVNERKSTASANQRQQPGSSSLQHDQRALNTGNTPNQSPSAPDDNSSILSNPEMELDDVISSQSGIKSFDEIPNKEAVLDYIDELSVGSDQSGFGTDDLDSEFEVHEVVKQFEQTADHTPQGYQQFEFESASSLFGGSVGQIKDQLLNSVDDIKSKASGFITSFSAKIKEKLNANQNVQYVDDFDQLQHASQSNDQGYTDQYQVQPETAYQLDQAKSESSEIEDFIEQAGNADLQAAQVPPSINELKFPKSKEQLLEEVESFQFASIRNPQVEERPEKKKKNIKSNESLEQIANFQFSSSAGDAVNSIEEPPELVNEVPEPDMQEQLAASESEFNEFANLEMPDSIQMQPAYLMEDSPGFLDKIKSKVEGFVARLKQPQQDQQGGPEQFHQETYQPPQPHMQTPVPEDNIPQHQLQEYTHKPLPPVFENIRRFVEEKLQGIAPENRSTIGGMILMVLGLVVGGAFVSLFDSEMSAISEDTMDQIAIDAHVLYNQEEQNFVGGTGTSTSEALQWLSARIGRPVMLADVQVSDFKYQKAIIIPTVYNYAAANIYVNKRKQSITLFVSAPVEDIQAAPLTCRIPAKVDGLCTWVSNSIRYTAIANLSLSRVRAFASEILSKTQ